MYSGLLSILPEALIQKITCQSICSATLQDELDSLLQRFIYQRFSLVVNEIGCKENETGEGAIASQLNLASPRNGSFFAAFRNDEGSR